MRNYAKISPRFWVGGTGRQLRNAGPDAMLVALYLLTNNHGNMIGLYYLPLPYLVHESGLSLERALKGLQAAVTLGFCQYDRTTEFVFISEMARFQVDDQLKANDKRCTGIQTLYESLPDNPFLTSFFMKYGAAFHLTCRRDRTRPSQASSEAPSKTLGSQEQEQEQEQVQKQAQEQVQNHPSPAEPKSECTPLPRLPLDEGEFVIAPEELSEYTLLYPAVEVLQEVRNMRGWLLSNPRRRKTESGIRRFVTAWLEREQHRLSERLSTSASQSPVLSAGRECKLPPNLQVEASRRVWIDATRVLSARVDRHLFETWLVPIKAEGLSERTLHLSVPHAGFLHVQEKYGALISEALNGAYEIEFSVRVSIAS